MEGCPGLYSSDDISGTLVKSGFHAGEAGNRKLASIGAYLYSC